MSIHSGRGFNQLKSPIHGTLNRLVVDPGNTPLFDFNPSLLNGVAHLDPRLLINGVTVTPEMIHNGYDANVTNWIASRGFGNTLTSQVAGAATFDHGSPLTGPADSSVLFDTVKWYRDDSSTSAGDIDTDDFVFETVYRHTPGLAVFAKWTGSGAGWGFQPLGGGQASFWINDGTGNARADSAALVSGAWYHIMYFGNRDGTADSQVYVNGLSSGSAISLSGRQASLGNTTRFSIGAYGTGGSPTSAAVAHVAMWRYPAWLQAGASGLAEHANIAADRFGRLTGTSPQRAVGTSLPASRSRTSAARLDKLEGGVRQLYTVGGDWIRSVSRTDKNTRTVRGALFEPAADNLFLQSEDISTTWTLIDAGDTQSLNSVEAPDKATTGDGLIADATNGPHGITQAVTLTAVIHSFSVFAKAGDQTHLLLENSTIANGGAWFNLSTGGVGTKQAGILESWAEPWGNGWYRCGMSFLGTAAAHTFEIKSAEADNDTAFAGDAATVNTTVWGAQVESRSYMTSYIPSGVSQGARSDDDLYYKGDDGNVSAGLVGSVKVDFVCPGHDNPASLYLFALSDGGSATDNMSMYILASDALCVITRESSGNDGDITATTDVTTGALVEARMTYATNALEVFVDRVAEGGDTLVDIPNDIDRINIGSHQASGSQLAGVITRLRIYD